MRFQLLLFVLFLFSCKQSNVPPSEAPRSLSGPYLIVLGTLQDAGSPQIGCAKACCRDLFENPDDTRKVASLGLVDPEYEKTYLLEATPDMGSQLEIIKQSIPFDPPEIPNGIFITHAHIGHYSGLQYLGKEALNSKNQAIYVMPQMHDFLSKNGPWEQLVKNKNIALQPLKANQEVILSPNLKIVPFPVPHRDEYSETVGYRIEGPTRKALFIPDIDKWERWEESIIEKIAEVDYAFLDATFFEAEEVGHRDIAEIPHPLVSESMSLLKRLPTEERQKVHFIHFNHTNPLLNAESAESEEVLKNDFQIASFKRLLSL